MKHLISLWHFIQVTFTWFYDEHVITDCQINLTSMGYLFGLPKFIERNPLSQKTLQWWRHQTVSQERFFFQIWWTPAQITYIVFFKIARFYHDDVLRGCKINFICLRSMWAIWCSYLVIQNLLIESSSGIAM